LKEHVSKKHDASESTNDSHAGSLFKGRSSEAMHADNILDLHRTIGNREVARLFRSGEIQAKLNIGTPGDIYEQEADRLADRVMRMPVPDVQAKPT